MNEVWVGVDVSKEGLDVAVRPGGEAWPAKNAAAGIKALINKLKNLTPQLIVLKATGGYELALRLSKAGLPGPIKTSGPTAEDTHRE